MRFRRALVIMLLACAFWAVMHYVDSASGEEKAQKLLEEARQAAQAGRLEDAVALCGKAIEADPKLAAARRFRGRLYDALKRFPQAIADYDALIELEPKTADHYDERGSVYFKNGQIDKSLADFGRAIALDATRERSHWKRGISYYYAGKFEEGRKQFEAYQTFDDNDVENAVWRYLCMARAASPQKAAAEMLKIKQDKRVPMMQVYDLYRGQAQPGDVLEAAKAGEPSKAELNQRLFYAYLYLGLYYDAAGDLAKALEYVTLAEQHPIGHYMWDVAHVHAELLRGKIKPPGAADSKKP